MLGSSSHGGAVAAYLGLPFVFGHFITSTFGPQVMAAYRRGFQPSAAEAEPAAAVAVGVICAGTDAEAERLALSADVWRLRPEGSARGALLAPEDAAAVTLTELDRAKIAQGRAAMVVGGPDRARRELVALAEAFGVDEVLVVTVCHDLVARVHSYELLAEAFSLPAAG